MFSIDIVVSGEAELGLRLDKLLEATNPKAILDQSGAILLNRMRTRFLSETSPSGEKWERSKAAIRREELDKGGGTLFDTGKLFHSLQLYATQGDEGEASRAIGTDVFYAPFVNYGTVKLPPRIFMDFAPEDVELMEKFIIGRIERALTQN